jgi:hypothetical protein
MRPESVGGAVGRLAGVVIRAVAELLAILREAIAIPVRLWMSAAEVLGGGVLAVWDVVRPVVESALALVARVIDRAARWLTPARAVTIVIAGATALLVASQFIDYRAVQVGGSAGRDVSSVNQAPQVAAQTPMDHHSVLVLLLAAAVVAGGVLALGHWRRARLLLLLGAAVVFVSLAIDAPAGLDEGRGGGAFNNVNAVLLDGFWAQLFAGVVIMVCGLLLAAYLRSEGSVSPRRRIAGLGEGSDTGLEGASP